MSDEEWAAVVLIPLVPTCLLFGVCSLFLVGLETPKFWQYAAFIGLPVIFWALLTAAAYCLVKGSRAP